MQIAVQGIQENNNAKSLYIQHTRMNFVLCYDENYKVMVLSSYSGPQNPMVGCT